MAENKYKFTKRRKPSQDKSKKEISEFINDSKQISSKFFEGTKMVNDMLRDTFSVYDPSSTPRKLHSSLLHSIKEKLLTGTTVPGFYVFADGAPTEMNRLITKAIHTKIKAGGFKRIFVGDEGLFDSMYTDGTAFLTIGYDVENGEIQFGHPKSSRVFFDKFATNIRRDGSETQAMKCLIVYEYDRKRAVKEFPEIEKQKIPNGKLPGMAYDESGVDRPDDTRQGLIDSDIIQIGKFYDTVEGKMKIIAGPSGTVLKGSRKENPFYTIDKKDRKKYFLPITNFINYSVRNGLYNPGIMQMFYNMSKIVQILDNKAINYTMNNIDDIKIVNIFQGKSDQFFADYLDAQEDQANGEKGIVLNEFSEEEPRGIGKVENLRSDPLTGELERMYARFDQILRREGINLDDVFTNPNKTKGAVMLEAEAQANIIRKILDRNIESWEFIVNASINFFKLGISNDDEEIVESSVNMAGEKMDITMGMVASWLRNEKYNWQTEINTESGVNKNIILQLQKMESSMQGLSPGSKAWNKITIDKAKLQGVDISMEELQGELPPTQLPSSNGM